MTKKRISPEVNAISTLLFATVLHPADRHQPAGGQSGEGGQEAPPLIFAAFSRENRKP